MALRIKRDKLGRIFIQDISEDEDRLQAADQAYEAHAFATADRIGKEVAGDIRHHFDKFGPQRLDGFNWISVVTEEWGETVAAYNQQNYEAVVKEGKQAIACIMRLIVEVEREMTGANVMERDRYGRAQ